MISSVLFPAGLFWYDPFYPLCEVKQSRMLTSRFAWTSDPKYSIWLTMMRYVSFSMDLVHILIIRTELMDSGIPFGFGLLAIFQGSYQYMMDAYGPYAASAVSPRCPFPLQNYTSPETDLPKTPGSLSSRSLRLLLRIRNMIADS